MQACADRGAICSADVVRRGPWRAALRGVQAQGAREAMVLQGLGAPPLHTMLAGGSTPLPATSLLLCSLIVPQPRPCSLPPRQCCIACSCE